VFKRRLHEKPNASVISSTKRDIPCLEHLIIRTEPSPINMLHWKIGEKMTTTIHVQNHEHLRYKTKDKQIKSILLSYNKASQSYCWREFCNSGNNEPNDTLMNVKCSGSITQPTRTANVSPVSRGGSRVHKNLYHDCEGVASQRA
jgi:hypothetical protein